MPSPNDVPPPTGREARRIAANQAIIAATTTLSEHREFDELAVLDICVEADISISSFYHRFPSKDALLREVHTQYLSDIRESLWLRLLSIDWEMADHGVLIAEIVLEYMQLRQEYASRFRTMALAEQRHEELALARQFADRVAVEQLADLFASRFEDERIRPEVRRRAAFITQVVVLVAQDASGLGRLFLPPPQSDARLLGEQLAEMAACYMGAVLTKS